MAKRTTKKKSSKKAGVPTRRNRKNAERKADNGKDRPVLSVKTNEKGQVFSHIRQKWLTETPEERVRQAYVVTLHNEYGFDLDQMDEELHVAGRGSARARADVVIWRTAQDKADSKAPLIVVECKSDNVTPLPVQRKIVAHWQAAQKYVAETEAKIDRLEREIETRFLADLGLKAPKQTTLLKAFAVPWRAVERWGVRPNQLATTSIDVSKSKYDVVERRSCLAGVRHGCSASPSPRPTGLDVLKISAATSGYFKPDERKYAFDKAQYRSDFGLRAGDVLMC